MSGVTIDISKVPVKHGVQKELDNKYYYNDDEHRERVDVTIDTKPSKLDGYVTLKYSPHNTGTKISGIQDSKSQTKFNDLDDCTSVSVYYWSLDKTFVNPLLIQLGDSEKYYKHAGSGNNWSKLDNITNDNLKQNLDKQNCEKNKAHQIDISKITSGKNTPYTCPSCGSRQVKVSAYHTHYYPYSCYYHYLSSESGNISGFQNGRTEQTGITLTDRISSVFVYYYPLADGIPVLIRLSGLCWFERASLDSSSWKVVSNSKLIGTNLGPDDPKIIQLLNKILPTVTINVGEGKGLTSGKSMTYPDPSRGGGGKQIKVERKDLGYGFVSFIHYILNETYFVIKEVKHNSEHLKGIEPSFIIKNVTVYYSVQGDDLSPDNLLMVKLEKRGTGDDIYVYYTRDSTGSNWILLGRQRETEKLDGPELVTKLDRSKKELIELSGIKSKLEAKREGNHQYTAGISAGIIAGIIIGIICAVASIAFLVWWKKRFIAKLIINL